MHARLLLLLTACLVLLSEHAAAQDSLIAVRPTTQVGSIGFRFSGSRTFLVSELTKQLELRGRGSLYGVRRVLGRLPLIRDPSAQTFDPVELQKDVVRLRRFYQESGFLRPQVDYRVRSKDDGNLVDVDFLISEGPAVALRSLTTVGAVGGPEWQAFRTDLAGTRIGRFGATESRSVEQRILTWLQDRGYPDAEVMSIGDIDSVHYVVDVTIRVEPGLRRKVGRVLVEGNRSVSDRVVSREVPFRPGDWLSADALAQGRSRVQQLPLFRQVVLDVPRQPDSIVPVRIRVTETHPRLTLAELGYISEGAGFTGRAQWTHPNFSGGARSLTASLEGQTGAGSIAGQGERLLRSSLTLTQPYVFARGILATAGPFAEYRDDYRDRSLAVGVTATLVHRIGDLSSLALQYRYSGRHIYEYRAGDVSSGDISLLTLLSLHDPSLFDSLGRQDDESTLGVMGTLGKVDDLVNPSRGVILRPSIRVTVPAGFNSAEFVRLDMSASRFQPVSRRVVLVGRASWARLYPFGKSVPGPDDDAGLAFLRLRDQSMTAGGTDDVRGWGTGLLGPKIPNVQATVEGSDTVLTADRWVPLGELARLTGSVELRFPAPGLSPNWGMHVFVDGGRVWTPDDRFPRNSFLPISTDFRFSAGGGISYQTPVGAIRLSLGYKINPSDEDLRNAGEVLDAVEAGSPVSSVPSHWLNRLHLHFSLGLAL